MEHSFGERLSKTAGLWREDGYGPLVLPLLYSTWSEFLWCFNWIMESCQKSNRAQVSQECDKFQQFDFIAILLCIRNFRDREENTQRKLLVYCLKHFPISLLSLKLWRNCIKMSSFIVSDLYSKKIMTLIMFNKGSLCLRYLISIGRVALSWL